MLLIALPYLWALGIWWCYCARQICYSAFEGSAAGINSKIWNEYWCNTCNSSNKLEIVDEYYILNFYCCYTSWIWKLANINKNIVRMGILWWKSEWSWWESVMVINVREIPFCVTEQLNLSLVEYFWSTIILDEYYWLKIILDQYSDKNNQCCQGWLGQA